MSDFFRTFFRTISDSKNTERPDIIGVLIVLSVPISLLVVAVLYAVEIEAERTFWSGVAIAAALLAALLLAQLVNVERKRKKKKK